MIIHVIAHRGWGVGATDTGVYEPPSVSVQLKDPLLSSFILYNRQNLGEFDVAHEIGQEHTLSFLPV